MYLRNLHVKSFRCLGDVEFEFQSGLNVLIGENNSGKTSIIDALRLCLTIGLPRRDIFLSTDDFFCDTTGKRSDLIEFDLTFSDPTLEEQGTFIDLLAFRNSLPELQLHVRYSLQMRNGLERIVFRYWGGENEGQSVAPEAMELLYYIYLGALRDAERDLAPSKGNRLGQLFLKLLKEPEEQKTYAETIQTKINEDVAWNELRRRAKEKVNENLQKITIQDTPQEVEINFIPLEFRRIVEGLKIQLLRVIKEGGPLHFEIEQNGLGYNNLIYIATVLGDLLERKALEKEIYIALLIEEPEAHLHPQLQDILFNFLGDVANHGIQIFITSHSPTVTSKTEIATLTVLEIQNNNIVAIALRKCLLQEDERKFLQRFLDVTKCQLFFAKRVVLVEGIPEALLLPVLAKIKGYDLDKSAVEIVNVGGTAFQPFAKLFNSEDAGKRLEIRCALITDGDEDAGNNISPRAEKAKDLEGVELRTFIAKKTFEHELYMSGNGKILTSTYKELHPNTYVRSADDLVEKLRQNKDKGIFAQLLSLKLIEQDNLRESFQVPSYINEALMWLFADNEQITD
jgi:putative ATP-dependent endonuclease of OLD family